MQIRVGPSNHLEFFRVCRVTKQIYSATAPFHDWKAWEAGRVPDEFAFPTLTDDNKRFVVYDITPEEFGKKLTV